MAVYTLLMIMDFKKCKINFYKMIMRTDNDFDNNNNVLKVYES